jgi:hypothetical protein
LRENVNVMACGHYAKPHFEILQLNVTAIQGAEAREALATNDSAGGAEGISVIEEVTKPLCASAIFGLKRPVQIVVARLPTLS